MTEPYRNPTQVYDGPRYDTTIGGHLYQWVAWHRGGHQQLAIGKRHLRVHGSPHTLCHTKVGRGSTRVAAENNDNPAWQWHTGDCTHCLRAAKARSNG